MIEPEIGVPAKRVNGRMWQSGKSGNPNGRPVGARGRFSQRFIADLTDAREKHGAAALEQTAKLAAIRNAGPSLRHRSAASAKPFAFGAAIRPSIESDASSARLQWNGRPSDSSFVANVDAATLCRPVKTSAATMVARAWLAPSKTQ